MFDRPADDNLVTHLVAVDTVARQVRSELREPLTWFYGTLLGMRSTDGTSEEDGGVARALRFVCERLSLTFEFTETPTTPAGHVTLLVNCIDTAEQRLVDHKLEYERLHGFSVTDQRIELYDPARHPVTLVKTWPF